MQAQIEIGFAQLIALVKQLPITQKVALKKVIDAEVMQGYSREDMENLLLQAPTLTEEEITSIKRVRNEISKWRDK